MVNRMHANDPWIAMFRRIPANLHETLALSTTSGAEIAIQKILKVEPDFVILRGRLTGTQDLGRTMVIPYEKLTLLSITRVLKDPEVEAIFGKGAPPAIADLAAVGTEEGASEPAPEGAVEDSASNEAVAAKKPAAVSKSALIAKLRDRLKDK